MSAVGGSNGSSSSSSYMGGSRTACAQLSKTLHARDAYSAAKILRVMIDMAG